MAHEDLYEADFLLWTERQAAELRALAHSCRDLPNALDLDHIAEEIEDLGRSELNAGSRRRGRARHGGAGPRGAAAVPFGSRPTRRAAKSSMSSSICCAGGSLGAQASST